MTDLELKVMDQIILNEMTQLNGAMPTAETDLKSLVCWTDCVEDAGSIHGKQLSGVMSNLVQKGLIYVNGKGREAACGPTAEGLAAYLEAKKSTCFVCSRIVAGEAVRVSTDLVRHPECRTGSKRWMRSEVGHKSEFRQYFNEKGEAVMFKQIEEMETKEMVAEYNKLTGKEITKFSDRATGTKQLEKARAAWLEANPQPAKEEKPAKGKHEKKAKPPVAEGAQFIKDRVQVDGVEYKSVRAAFTALGLPDNKHVKFRLELKAARTLAFEFEGKSYTFTVVSKA